MNEQINRWVIIGVIVILIGGIAATVWTARNEDEHLRKELILKSSIVKEGISSDQVTALTGTAADLSSPEYNSVKQEITRMRFADPRIRFIYFMGMRADGAVIFLVDSESPESEDYSPPGQEYPEASKALLNAFVSKEGVTEGPASDRWGTWVSSIIPIIDPETGTVIAIFGIDIDARDWNLEIFTASLPVIIATCILILILLIFAYAHQRNEREKKILAQSEMAARESEHKLNDIIDFLPDATFVINLEGTVIAWNKAIEEMTGVKAADMLGKGNYEYALPFYGERRPILIDFIQNRDPEIAKKYTGGVYMHGDVLYTETQVHRPDRSDEILAVKASALRDVEGKMIGAIESIRDITSRVTAEEQLKESEERFRLVAQNVNDGLIVHSIPKEGPWQILDVNERACQILGYSGEELLKKSMCDLFVPEERKRAGVLLHEFYSRGQAFFETEFMRKSGQGISLEISARFFEMKGMPTVLAALRDITERRLIERETEIYTSELQRYSDALHQVNNKLNLMNSITRHDINNQIIVLLGYLEIIKEEFPDPTLQRYLDSGIYAARNIQNQIMFTREYQDIGSQTPKWFDLARVIGSAVQRLPLSGITLSVDCDAVEIYADPLLEKVFYTLFENALRHGKTITKIMFSCQESRDGLMVIYEDNGVGVPVEHKEDIFQRRFFKHTGYGLFLSASILQITGISIKETGVPGKGARFELLVPKGSYLFHTQG